MKKDKILIKRLTDPNDKYLQNACLGGVYAIINILKKYVYIGETGNFDVRLESHCDAIFSNASDKSNKNLALEDEKQFCWTFLATFSKTDKKSDNKYWFALETLIMYFFVDAGFKLYNGSNDGRIKDNLGKKRDFLLSYDNNAIQLKNKTINYLTREYPNVPKMISNLNSAKWDDSFITKAKVIFIEDLKRTFGNFFNSFFLVDDLNTIKVQSNETAWNDFVKRANCSAQYQVLSSATWKTSADLYKFNKEYLKTLGTSHKFEEISFQELLRNGKLENFIYTHVGDYLGESITQILNNKIIDLQSGSLGIIKNNISPTLCIKNTDHNSATPVCLWSLSGKQEKWLRSKLNEKFNQEDIYILMHYTGSKSKSFSNDIPRIVKSLSLDRTKKTEIYNYPNDYKPEIINTTGNSMAFLISNFYYLKEDLNCKDITEFTIPIYEGYNNSAPLPNTTNRKPFYLLSINNKKGFQDKLSLMVQESNNSTGMILAKVPYPYIVAVE